MKTKRTDFLRLKANGLLSLIMFSLFICLLLVVGCKGDEPAPDKTPPGEAKDFAVEARDAAVTLSWKAPDDKDKDMKGYNLTYTPDKPATPLFMDAATTTTSNSKLKNDTEYTFTLSTVDKAGNVSKGVSVKATPSAPKGTLFTEDFETDCPADQKPGSWVTFSPNGTAIWACSGRVTGTTSMQANNFDFTGAREPARDWLISPKLQLPKDGEYFIFFDYSSNGAEQAGYGLSVKVSNDYSGSGDPSQATWKNINAGIQEVNSGVNAFTLKGKGALSGVNGNTYLAFYYTSSGSASGQTRRIFVDNVRVGLDDGTDTFAPGNVGNLTAIPGDGSIRLTWRLPGDEDLAGLRLNYTPGGTERTLAATATESEVTGLTNGTEYKFTVVSFDASGNSSDGVSVSAIPKAPVSALLSENFNETCPQKGGAPSGGWTVFSKASNRDWACGDRNKEASGFSMEINGFRGDTGSKDWLISPKISLVANNSSILTFDYSQRYSDDAGFGLAVRISKDYSGSGDPTTATWTTLDAGIAGTASDTPVSSSEVSLSAYSGDVYVAFYYTSSGAKATRVTVDNVVVSN